MKKRPALAMSRWNAIAAAQEHCLDRHYDEIKGSEPRISWERVRGETIIFCVFCCWMMPIKDDL